LTYAFSKSWTNLKAALALHFWHSNFARVHSALRITPAMAAGIGDHVWTITELLAWWEVKLKFSKYDHRTLLVKFRFRIMKFTQFFGYSPKRTFTVVGKN
jgi:hypothetical protein